MPSGKGHGNLVSSDCSAQTRTPSLDKSWPVGQVIEGRTPGAADMLLNGVNAPETAIQQGVVGGREPGLCAGAKDVQIEAQCSSDVAGITIRIPYAGLTSRTVPPAIGSIGGGWHCESPPAVVHSIDIRSQL